MNMQLAGEPLLKVPRLQFTFTELTFCPLALPESDQNIIHAMDIDYDSNPDTNIEGTTNVVPGDEGFDISHEGGEFEVFNDLVEGIQEINGLYVVFTCDTKSSDNMDQEAS